MGQLTGGDPSLLRRINSAVVLHALRATDAATLTEITRVTGLSRPTVEGVVEGLIEAGQKDGSIKPLPAPQLLGFCAGSLAMPILFGGAIAERDPAAPLAKMARSTLLSDAALDQRIELALSAISNPQPRARSRPRARKPKAKT